MNTQTQTANAALTANDVPVWITETVTKWQEDMARLLNERDARIKALEAQVESLELAVRIYELANKELMAR